MYAEYKVGNVKETIGQKKKHVSQMSDDEILFLTKKIDTLNIQSLRFSSHCMDKITDEIDSGYITAAILGEFKIIEYNQTPTYSSVDARVLIRDSREKEVIFERKDGSKFKQKAQLCIVISLIRNQVITCYWNIANDNHHNVNLERYDVSLKVS